MQSLCVVSPCYRVSEQRPQRSRGPVGRHIDSFISQMRKRSQETGPDGPGYSSTDIVMVPGNGAAPEYTFAHLFCQPVWRPLSRKGGMGRKGGTLGPAEGGGRASKLGMEGG